MQLGGLAELVEVAEVAVLLAEDERQVVQDDSPVGILRGQAVQSPARSRAVRYHDAS